MDDQIPLTPDQAAILRAWLGGVDIPAIAAARRITPAAGTAGLADVCGLDRTRGQAVLDSGLRSSAAVVVADEEDLRRRNRQLRAELDATLRDLTQVRVQRDEARSRLGRPAPS